MRRGDPICAVAEQGLEIFRIPPATKSPGLRSWFDFKWVGDASRFSMDLPTIFEVCSGLRGEKTGANTRKDAARSAVTNGSKYSWGAPKCELKQLLNRHLWMFSSRTTSTRSSCPPTATPTLSDSRRDALGRLGEPEPRPGRFEGVATEYFERAVVCKSSLFCPRNNRS